MSFTGNPTEIWFRSTGDASAPIQGRSMGTGIGQAVVMLNAIIEEKSTSPAYIFVEEPETRIYTRNYCGALSNI